MNISFTLNQIIPLSWWQTEIEKNPHDHVGPGSLVIATAMFVSYVWGKYSAVGFLSMAFVIYPFSHRHIRYFMFLDVCGSVHAAACVAIPVLCSKIPFLSTYALLFHVAHAYSIQSREWRLCQATHKTSDEIKKLEQDNQTLKKDVSGLQTNAFNLNEEMTRLIDKMHATHQLRQEANNITREKNEVGVQVDVNFNALNEKLASLVKVCQVAIQQEGLDALMGQVDENQTKLSRLTSQCEAKNKELEKLIGEMKLIKDRLAELVPKLASQEIQTQEKLTLVNTWLQAIMNLRI